MVKHIFPLLILSTLFFSGCVNRTPPTPPLTQAQLNNTLSETEMRLSEQMKQQCQGWIQQQQTQFDQFKELQESQLQIDRKIDELDQKLSQKQAQPVVVAAAKPAQCPPPSVTNTVGNKLVLGRVEWLWIEAVNRVFKARIDTGATTSSISAQDVVVFERDGKRWVRFRLAPDETDDRYEVEAPLVRHVRIRQSSGDGDKLDRRPVVSLKVKVGNLIEDTEFTLTDRSHMLYPILLGREFLKDIAVVDVAKKFIQPEPPIIKDLPQAKPEKDSKDTKEEKK
ncbi:ATP-dependent zinc protease [Methylophaga sp. OBS4]|uniref:ATP-dependent zinc protease family protein n=1 Tax=Methylophaga sp. OBS4 TaxID=2991935 RepID=UPI002254C123|nr:ATP-dependent zinc protease [Methylophaga sp. OBS4]MCX4186712.1 ATP-dependent zinc protease [Methylophaga sp. OBS4]